MITFGSICSGIEAASVAWLPLGWKCAFFSEIDPFACAVLAHHFPDVPNLGDMLELDPIECADIDLLVAGTPCQAFSISGLRKGLNDERGQLTMSFVRLIEAIDAIRHNRGQSGVIVVWENVPNVLSDRTNAFGCFLGALAGEDEPLIPSGDRWTGAGVVLGPERAIAWRCLDAQYFGLAQRRKRVFVVASPRDGIDPTQVLFEFEGVRRDTQPGRGPKKNVAKTLEAGIGRSRGSGIPTAALVVDEISMPLKAKGNDSHDESHQTYVPVIFDQNQITSPENRSTCRLGSPSPTLSESRAPCLAFHIKQDPTTSQDVSLPLDTKCDGHGLMLDVRVRRLMPVECERLMGFSDDYTMVPYRAAIQGHRELDSSSGTSMDWKENRPGPAIQSAWGR